MSKGSVTYSMKFQARVLQPNAAERSRSQWLVGSTCLREENELRVLEYDAAQESLRSVQVWVHPEEIWDVAANSASTSSFVTVHSQAGVYGATLWRGEAGSQSLQSQAKLRHEGIVRRALWHNQNTGVLITVEEAAFRKWQVSDHAAQCVSSTPSKGGQKLWSATLHPKRPDLAATAAGDSVQLWDINNMTKTGEIPGAHSMAVRDVDFAAQNEHRMVTAADDCKLRFWDLRMLGKHEALLELGGHSHWVWRAKYNPQHDQLLVSSSSDASVSLWYMPVLAKAAGSPAPVSRSPKQASHRQEVDGRVQSYDEHEDSVYGLAWNLADPWLFASLSYDGRVVINTVPKNVKYKILI